MDCSIHKTVDIIGKRWTLLILLELYKGKKKVKRYSEIKAKISDITPKMLSMRLHEMESEGLISKKVDTSTVPIKSEYQLTQPGNDLIKVVKDIKKWSMKHKARYKHCMTSCKDCRF